MPHMLDKHIIEEMQERWSGEFDITSSHHFRAGDDMQYSFSYFYYLMHAVKPLVSTHHDLRDLFRVVSVDAPG